MSNATNDSWYNYMKEDGTPSRLVLAVFGIRCICATFGTLFNLAILHVTVANKSLHGVCNILIALESFFGIFKDVSYFVSFIIFLSGIKFIPYGTCFLILVGMNVWGNCAQMTMVLTGVDRLLCVLFPIWYKKRHKWHGLLVAGTVLTLYTIYWLVIYYFEYHYSDHSILVSCSPYETGKSREMGPLMNMNGTILSAAMMTAYTLIWLFAFLIRPTAKHVNKSSKKLIKSLILLIGMNMVGVYFKTTFSFFFNTFWKIDVFVKNPLDIGTSFLTILVYSANAPVLYLISTEYRSKFNVHFPWLDRLFSTSSSPVISIQDHMRATQWQFKKQDNNVRPSDVESAQMVARDEIRIY